MAYNITDIINWAKISQPLAAIGEAKKMALQGGSVEMDLDIRIYITRKDVEYEYAQDPTSDILFSIGNYLYALCAPYIFQAQFIDGGSGGNVTPLSPSSTTVPDPYDWEVGASTSPLAGGESTVIIPEFRGYNIEFTRGGVTQNTTNTGGSYYSWNRVTGSFTCYPAATISELFRLLPTR